jgi:hypothetical protein
MEVKFIGKNAIVSSLLMHCDDIVQTDSTVATGKLNH